MEAGDAAPKKAQAQEAAAGEGPKGGKAAGKEGGGKAKKLASSPSVAPVSTSLAPAVGSAHWGQGDAFADLPLPAVAGPPLVAKAGASGKEGGEGGKAGGKAVGKAGGKEGGK